jgi:hypothetical protein
VPALTFKIGDAFPADDPVAWFVTVVAMMSNDWLRLSGEMVAIDDADPDALGRRVWSFRLQAALHYEAAEFLNETPPRFRAIGHFLSGLGPEARAEYDRVAILDNSVEDFTAPSQTPST